MERKIKIIEGFRQKKVKIIFHIFFEKYESYMPINNTTRKITLRFINTLDQIEARWEVQC